ncbi:hypothetical protein ABW19_dt0200874 [Dactylella cylindrospora]|nr:hypothetical protein ABW19_dt0200874 [Dactylella cylindrospora]
MATDTSIPLYKRGSRTSSVGSRKTLLSHSRTISSQDQITPPPTPRDGTRPKSQTQSIKSAPGSGTSSKRSSARSSASKPGEYPFFMRAFYTFKPPNQPADTTTITLPLSPGDMVMIHNIHVNGWADGTTLASGARGWLPTNFCAEYEAEQMQSLLKACVILFDQLRGAATEGFEASSQAAVGEVVNGVRFLLEATDCLTREAYNVLSDESIRKTRKVLLAELSVLVKTAKSLPDQLEGDTFSEYADDLIDAMILSSFRVVVRAAKFLDAWTEIHEPLPEEMFDDEVTTIDEETPEESCEQSAEEGSESTGDRHSTHTTATSYLEQAAPTATTTTTTKERPHGLTIITPQYQPDGQTSFLALTPASTVKESDSEMEIVDPKEDGQVQVVLATARLNSTYDSLLSCLATYIGTIHLKAPLPSRLFELTKEAVEVGTDFLEVIEHVNDRVNGDSTLDHCRTTFKEDVNSLVTEAQVLVKPILDNEDEAPLAGNESQPLIDAATKCVQGATFCFDTAHGFLEQISDFEITLPAKAPVSQIGIGITTTVPTAPVVDGLNSPTSPKSEISSPIMTKLNLDKSLPSLPAVDTPKTIETAEPTPTTVIVPATPAKVEPASRRGSEATDDVEKRRSGGSTVATSFSMQREDSQQSALTDEEQSSTRATTPIHDETETPLASPKLPLVTRVVIPPRPTLDQMESVPPTPQEEKDNPMIQKSHGHRLMYNKDGQLAAGSLVALIEQMTMPDSKPDMMFVTTFFLTFRHWSSPTEITNALIDRFDEVNGNLYGSTPVRLRVYNVFKQWLETHWKKDTDMVVLDIIREFAINKLRPVLATPGERLQELSDKVANLASDTSLVPREPTTLQKSRSAVGLDRSAGFPEPRVTRSQYNILRSFQANGGEVPSVLEFDPHEIAKQLTHKDCKIFCQIAPHELLGKEWGKKEGSRAANVLAMTALSTDMAHWVAFTILNDADPKKRAAVIKHWIKVADKLFEMANYNTLMAIMCSLNTSTIVRLKKTWELVSPKSKAALEKLRSVVDVSKNFTELRNRLRNQMPPCLPFLGTYLTDLTFADDGNPDKRAFPDEDPKSPSAINIDKYQRITKMILELQNFQVPYPIQEVPELQYWIEYQMKLLRESGFGDVQKLYRQSLAVEPRKRDPPPPTPSIEESAVAASATTVSTPSNSVSEKSGFLGWAHSIKEKSSIASFNLAMSNP